MLYTFVAVLVIILDQWVKYWVAGNLSVGVGIKEFIPGIVSLVNVHNDGAAFSFLSGSGARIYFIIICGVFTVGVIIALATNLISGPIGRWSAVLVVAGGLSNCIDRILYGYVQDMFRLDFWPSFAVFNVADIFITVFCFVFILYVLFGGEKQREYDDDEDQYEEDDEEEDAKPLFKRGKSADRGDAPAARRPAPADRPQRSAPAAEPRRNPKPQRKTKYEEEYEQYKAARAARQQAQAQQGYPDPAPVQQRTPAPQMDPADPFAEWERANARVEAQRDAYAAAAMGRTPAPAAQSAPRDAAPAQARPAVPAAPAYRPAAQQPVYHDPAPQKPVGSDGEFSLDDILNEFK